MENILKYYDSIKMTDRIRHLKQQVVEIPPEICVERANIVTQTYCDYEAYPVIVKRAQALSQVLKKMSIYIEKGEMIVGNQASKPRSAPIFPEYSWDWIIEEMDSFDKRTTDTFFISEENKTVLRNILSWWKHKTLKETAEVCQSDEVLKATDVGVIEWVGNVTSGEGHIAVDYKMCMQYGYAGIIKLAQDRLDSFDLSNPEDIRQQDFLKAVCIVLQAGIDFKKRYSDLVKKMMEDEGETEELKNLYYVLGNVPTNPPKTFREGLQMLWFTHVILQIEASGHSMSLGRMDQYLYDLFQKDIYDGKLTYNQAVELLDCFYIKLFSINKLRNYPHSRVIAGYPTYQNIVVGGQKANGEDAVNELSFCMVKALEHIRLPEPNFYIRYHENISTDFIMKALDVVALGIGMPAFVNDKVCISSLQLRGVKLEDAVEYSTMGCLEIEVPGMWGYRANGKSKFNMAKVLELAMFAGKDPRTGIQLLDTKKTIKDCTSFEEFFALYEEQMKYYIRLQVEADNVNDYCMEGKVPDAFCSALVNDCIKRGKHIKQGGPIYDWISGAQIGVPNIGNSMAALKSVVFDQKLVTPAEMEKAIESNFEGERNAQIQKLLLNSPKYGNDEDFVDLLTKRAYDVYCEEILNYKNMRLGTGPLGCGWYASTVTLTSNIPGGEIVGALPNGRKKGEPLADGVSPEHGTEKEGPTSVVKSVAKLSTELVTGGQLLNMRFIPTMLKQEKGKRSVHALMRTFFQLEGWHIQFNVISSDVLMDARKHPDRYKDLVVRVAGYSALFVALDPAIQEDIISRTQYNFK